MLAWINPCSALGWCAYPAGEWLMNEPFLDSFLPGILAITAEQVVCGMNAAAERLLGLKAAEHSGRVYSTLPSPLREFISEALQADRPLERALGFPSSGKMEGSLQVSSTLCWGSGGQRTGIVVSLVADELRQQLGRMDRLATAGTLSAGLAHEIKNALVAVNTFVDDLVLRNKDSELAELVKSEIQRIDRIVSQLLNLAVPPKPRRVPVSLRRVLERSLRLIQSRLSAKQVRVSISLPVEEDRIQGDEYQLEQACINLLLNAVEAIRSDGILTIETRLVPGSGRRKVEASGQRLHDWVQLSIADNGVGIHPAQLNQIFELFFSTRPDGTGLGLAITRQIVREHGGEITVESELNKGTTFRLRFPVANSDG